METMNKDTIKEMIEQLTEKGYAEEDIMRCIRQMVGAKPKENTVD